MTHLDWFYPSLAPDGRPIAATAPTKPTEVILWDLDRDRQVGRLRQPAEKNKSKAWAVDFSGDGKRLGVGRDEGSQTPGRPDPAATTDPLAPTVQASGVNPSTMSNFAASSPIRESEIGAKSIVTESRALGSFRLR
jgi:hypothetical protein